MYMKAVSYDPTHAHTEYRKVQVKEGGIANMHPQLTVKGVGYDQLLGGLEMDMRLRDYLAKAFTVSSGTYICFFV